MKNLELNVIYLIAIIAVFTACVSTSLLLGKQDVNEKLKYRLKSQALTIETLQEEFSREHTCQLELQQLRGK